MSENGEIYTASKKFYTPAGTDGMDKFHLCAVYSLDCQHAFTFLKFLPHFPRFEDCSNL